MRYFIILLCCVCLHPAFAQDVLMLDDFEDTFTPSIISINRRAWFRSSSPFVEPFDSFLPAPTRGKLIWYNPYEQVDINDIYPGLELNSRTGRLTNALVLERRFDSNHHPVPIPDNEWWGGITAPLPIELQDLNEFQAIELLVQGIGGILYIDIGHISEDQNDDGELQSEDNYGEMAFENGILEDGEDIGLDGVAAIDGPNNHEQYDDDWKYIAHNRVYLNINGTENNGSGDIVDGLRIPDTEDINQNGVLDTSNDYFTYRLALDPSDIRYNRYLVGGTMNALDVHSEQAPDYKWRKFRIPLDAIMMQTGHPNLHMVPSIRIRVENLPLPDLADSEAAYTSDEWNMQSAYRRLGQAPHLVSVASIGFLPMKWNVSEIFSPHDPDSLLSAAPAQATFVNTVQSGHANYERPPRVRPQQDPILGFVREQSLELEYRDLPPLTAGAVTYQNNENNSKIGPHEIQQFDFLELFVHGEDMADQQDVDYFVRFGEDEDNFFEMRGTLYAGWDERNNVIIPLGFLSYVQTSRWMEYDWHTGKLYRKVGNPSLSKILNITFGVINNQETGAISGNIWFDELRVRKGIDSGSYILKTDDALVLQNYPNPFNASTSISFGLPVADRFSLEIYDILGRKVRSLVNDESGTPGGAFSIEWDGRDNNGHTLPSGVYIVLLQYTNTQIIYHMPVDFVSYREEYSGIGQGETSALTKSQRRTRSVSRKILMLK